MNEKICFDKNGKLRILQVSDAQDMHIARPAMLRMLSTAYDLINPDLVVFTGDNVLANHLEDAMFGSRKVVKTREGSFKRIEKAIAHILRPLEKRKIPFALIFGNHDDMCRFTKEEESALYEKYEGCISPYAEGSGVNCGTYNIPIYSSDGEKIAYNLWMIDSAGHDKDGNNGFEHVSKAVVGWYVKKSKELQKANGGMPVPSIMFQHIPVPEITQLLIECDKEKSAVERNGKFYKLNPKLARGVLGEYPHPCADNYGQFDAVVSRGDVRAIVFGHDHKNCFTGKLNGIDIIQTPCASFRCYGNEERGVRLFELDEADTQKYTTKNISYYDIFGKGPLQRLLYIMDADDKATQKYALMGVVGAAAVGVAALKLHSSSCKNK